jgi:hypothetical protein
MEPYCVLGRVLVQGHRRGELSLEDVRYGRCFVGFEE